MNFSKILFFASVGLAIGMSFLMGGNAVAGTLITSIVHDSDTFTPTMETIVPNGDFSIRSNNGGEVTFLGDGANELTQWDFDFSNNLYLQNFIDELDKTGLKQALITFEITPKNVVIDTDETGIDRRKISQELLPELGDYLADEVELKNELDAFKSALDNQLAERKTFTLNLLGDNLIDESALIGAFKFRNDNKIPWFWRDDATLHGAVLTLETRDVSELQQ